MMFFVAVAVVGVVLFDAAAGAWREGRRCVGAWYGIVGVAVALLGAWATAA